LNKEITEITATNETGIVYKVQTTQELCCASEGKKKEFNHKRLQLHIKRIYPEDYDFDIVFKSKDYRKMKNQLDRKHVEGLILEDED
jgi:hypothetical protein